MTDDGSRPPVTDRDPEGGVGSDGDSEPVRLARTERERGDAFAVRRRVFVEEQGVPERLEWDGKDDDAVHVVAYDGDRAVGTARLRLAGGSGAVGKVERVAVLEPARGEGWGRRLMGRIEAAARERGVQTLTLHAQTRAAGFYDRLGYRRVGGEFEEAGLPHVEMRKAL